MNTKRFAILLVAILFIAFLVVKKPFTISMGIPEQTAALASISTAPKTTPRPNLDNRAELGAFLDHVLTEQLDTYHIAGATVIIVRDDEVLLAKGYGFADREAGLPVDPEATLFRIGSITKLFTWTAVMQLVEKGILDLDADINTYLDFTIPPTFPQPITLKHLMTHTAGFEEMGFGLFADSLETMVSNGQWLKTHIPARVREPGLVSAYSNYGSALAGYIVERQAGLPYEEYIERYILTPLRMTRTSAAQPLPGNMASAVSQGYRFNGTAFVAYDFELVNAAPAGSISASSIDMARFMIAHLNEGEYQGQRILSDRTTTTMHSRIWGADKRLNGWAHGFYELNQNGIRSIGHGGDTRLFHSLLALLPAEKVGFFVSYNTETNSMAPQELFTSFMDRYYPEALAELPPPPAGTLARASQVAGSYRVNRSVYTRAGKIDSLLQPLMVQAGKDGSLTIPTPMGVLHFVETAPYYYEQVGGDNKAVFWVDGSGRVTYSFINSFPMMAAERLPWYEASILHLSLAAVCLLFFLSTIVLALVGFFLSRLRSKPPVTARMAVVSRWMLVLASITCLAFVALYVVSLNDPMLRLTGQRGLLDLLGWIALFELLLAVTCAAFTLNAWAKRYWSLVGRLHYTAVTACAITFTILLVFYNQIGWQW
jgi:CubicO group peptidase (beta-lactamase class C family)